LIAQVAAQHPDSLGPQLSRFVLVRKATHRDHTPLHTGCIECPPRHASETRPHLAARTQQDEIALPTLHHLNECPTRHAQRLNEACRLRLAHTVLAKIILHRFNSALGQSHANLSPMTASYQNACPRFLKRRHEEEQGALFYTKWQEQ
jgi:hypothetical protein